jgi:DNA-binding transcriptional ArsR family regulator
MLDVVRIKLSDADVAATRVAFSPLWETLAGLLMLRDGDPPWPYRDWARVARDFLRGPAVAALAPVLGCVPCVPDCLMPAPEHPCESLEDELDRVAHVDARAVREGFRAQFSDGVPSDLEAFVSSPSRAVGAFADALFSFWESAIAPDWPVMRGLLEREVLVRARSVASSGGEGLFVGLHPRIRWRRPFLELDKRQYDFYRVGDGRGIVVVPLVFGRAGLLFAATPGLQFAISYTPPGVGTIWTAAERPQEGRTRLELLLGDGRAAVLGAIAEPRTTVDVAARLGMAASTVSHHLAVLRGAELVLRRRLGHRVFYELNDTGRALMALLGASRDSVGAGFDLARIN